MYLNPNSCLLLETRKLIPRLIYLLPNDQNLEACESYKYLGVIIDKNLAWNSHIEYTCKKITKACGSFSKLRHCVNTDILVSVYYALVHSYLRYGIASWGCPSTSSLQPLIKSC